jgi:hypothetical protein
MNTTTTTPADQPKRIYGVLQTYKGMVKGYQNMKETAVSLLVHPDATDAELKQVREVLIKTQDALLSMADKLNAEFGPVHHFHVDGVSKRSLAAGRYDLKL